jgi:hypothetical protein
MLQVKSLLVVRCILIFFLLLFSFSSFQIFFSTLTAMASLAAAPAFGAIQSPSCNNPINLAMSYLQFSLAT